MNANERGKNIRLSVQVKPVFPTFQIIFPFEKSLNCIFLKMSFFSQISVKQYFENIERENYNHLIIDNSVYY
jgi:hypothetical protein